MTKMIVPILVDEGFNWSAYKSCPKCIFYKDGISCDTDTVKNRQDFWCYSYDILTDKSERGYFILGEYDVDA